jgi:hypothetical protein
MPYEDALGAPLIFEGALKYPSAHDQRSELSPEHPARVAYSSGAREASDSISLTWLVADRRDMVQASGERR